MVILHIEHQVLNAGHLLGTGLDTHGVRRMVDNSLVHYACMGSL